jgi:hypothetical protein
MNEQVAKQFEEQKRAQWIAQMAHEVNRAYAEMIGDHSLVAWDESPDWQKSTVLNGVEKHLNNPNISPEASHRSWMDFKKADGWVYGPTKDVELKEHPCMLNYADLPISQRMKDYIFAAVVKAANRMWTP